MRLKKINLRKILPFILIPLLAIAISYTYSNYLLRTSMASSEEMSGTELIISSAGQKIVHERISLDNSSLDLELAVRNNSPHTSQYKLLIVNNNRQIDFLSGSNNCRGLDIELSGQQEKEIPLAIKGLNDGLNELIIILIKHDVQALSSGGFIPPTMIFSYKTLEILVDDSETSLSLPNIVNVHEEPTNNGEVFGLYLLKNIDSVTPEGIRALTQDSVSGPGEYPFAFYRAFPENFMKNYSLIMFCDYQQIPITHQGQPYDIFFCPFTNKEAVIPVSIELAEGEHYCFAMMLTYDDGNKPLSNRVLFSNLANINVTK